jgi:cobalt/nickel transport system permease protein
MSLALDPHLAIESFLTRLDPRWKLAALMGAAPLVLVLRSPYFAAVVAAASLVLVILARIPLRWYLARTGTFALVLVLFIIWLPFLGPSDGQAWPLGPLAVSPSGLRAALLLLFKTVCVVNLVLVLLATGPLNETLQAASRLHVPALLVHLSLLSYRYVFLFGHELTRLRIALRVRGYRNRPRIHSYRTIGHVAGTLLVRSAEQADRVSQAMRCRGFDGRFRTIADFRTTWADRLFAWAVLGFSAIVLACDLALG